MEATIGDRIAVIVDSYNKPREATVIDIREPSADNNPTYLVEWADNGHRQLVALGPGARIELR